MTTVALVIFCVALIAMIPLFAAAWHCNNEFERHLQQAHPATWAAIAPAPGTEPSTSSPSARFVTQRTYRTLGDARLDELGDQCFTASHMAMGNFLVLVLSGLAWSVLRS